MNTLKAEKRSLSVKPRRLRREGYVTGNLFGRKLPSSIAIQMTKKEVSRLLSTERKGSQIMLDVDGESYDVLIKDIEYDMMQNQINEIDFQALVSDEKVHSTVEITFLNMDRIVSGVFQTVLTEVPYKAYPSALVSEVKVDVGMLKIDDVIRVKDLDIAKNKDIELMIDLESVLASVLPVHNETPEDKEEEAEGATK